MWLIAGLLAMLAVATRSIGVTLVAGACVAALTRRLPKVALAMAAFGAAGLAPGVLSGPPAGGIAGCRQWRSPRS